MCKISYSPVPRSIIRLAFMVALVVPVILFTGCGDGLSATDHLEAANNEMQAGNLRGSIIHLKNALQKDPRLIAARRVLGEAYLIVGFGADAEKEFKRAVESDGARPEDSNSLIRALVLQGKFQEALELLPAEGGAVSELILKGEALAGLKNRQDAALYYKKAIAEDPAAAEAYKGMARLALIDGDTTKTSGNISKALESAPKDVEAWLMKGLLAAHQKRTVHALEAFDTALKVSRYELSRHVHSTHSAAAGLLLDNNQPDQAKPHIDAIGKRNSQEPLYKYLDARFNYQKGDLDTAVTQLRDVVKSLPNHGPSLLLLGVLERERGNLGQAGEHLIRALSIQPDNLPTRQLLGLVYVEQKQYPAAIRVLEPVVRALPDEAYSWTLLGIAYIGNGELDGATDALKRASASNPESADIRNQMAVGYFATGQNDVALRELRKAMEFEPENFQAGYLTAAALLQKGDFQAALEAARQLFEKHPDKALLLNLMGTAYVGLDDLESARRLFTQAAKLDQEYVTPLVNLVKLDMDAGRVDEARRGYEDILIRRPANPGVLVGLAKLLLLQGQLNDALDRLQQARTHNRDDLESRLLLAELYSQQGRNAEVLQIVEEALSIHPEDTRSLLLHSRVQLLLGELDSARASVTKLLQLEPESGPALYLLAELNIRAGQRDEGLAILKKLLKLHPDHAAAKIALSNLELWMGVPPGKQESHRAGGRDAGGSTGLDNVIQTQALLSRGKVDEALAIAQAAVKKSPQSTKALVTLGGVYRAKGDFSSARQAFQKILSLKPSSSSAELNLASLAIQEGDLEAAKAHYKKVLKRFPNHLQATVGLAALSKAEQAEQLLNQAIAAHPAVIEPIVMLAQLYLKGSQWQEAIDIAQKGLKRESANITLLQIAGSALLVKGDLETANRLVNRLLERAPNLAQAWMLRGQIRQLQKSFSQGREDLKKALKLQPNNPRIKVILAALEIELGQSEKAVEILRNMLDKQPKIAAGWMLLGDANWHLKRTKQAVENYIQADKLQHSGKSVIKLARAHWGTGNKDQAKDLLRKWLNSNPADAEGHNALGDMLMVEKKWSAASLEYEDVLKILPNNAVVMNKLASAYENQGDARAESTLEAAYKLDDRNPDILDAYGSLLIKREQFQKGINVLRMAVSLEKQVVSPADRATMRFHLAEAYRLSGNINAAVRELKTLLSTEVSFPEKDRAKSILSGLQ